MIWALEQHSKLIWSKNQKDMGKNSKSFEAKLNKNLKQYQNWPKFSF